MVDAPDTAVLAELRALSQRVEIVGKDAREARDATIRLDARVGGDDTPAQLAKIAARIETIASEARTDLVNSMDKNTRELRDGQAAQDRRVDALALDVTTRLAALEAWRNKLEGAGGLFGWLSKNWTLIAVVGGWLWTLKEAASK